MRELHQKRLASTLAMAMTTTPISHFATSLSNNETFLSSGSISRSGGGSGGTSPLDGQTKRGLFGLTNAFNTRVVNMQLKNLEKEKI